MVGRLRSYGARSARLARRALRLAVIAAASAALLTVATARESQAYSGAETGRTVTARVIACADYAVNADTASVSAGEASVQDINRNGVTSAGQFGASCLTGHGSACPTAVAVVGVSAISLDDTSGRVFLRDEGRIRTKQIPRFRPPSIVA